MEDLVLSEGGACGVFAGGAARCWGTWYGELFPESTAANGLTDVVELRVGQNSLKSENQLLDDFFCARFSSGGIQCWGNGAQGQLGSGVSTDLGSMSPVAVEGMPPRVVGLALGWRHACAVTSGGDAFCWGSNEEGQLGLGATTGAKVSRPSLVQLPGKVTQLVASLTGTCALLEGGDVYCWGEHWTREPGESPKRTAWWPKLVTMARGSRQLSAASSTMCSVRLDGRVVCWGHLESYLGPKYGLSAEVPGIADATAVAIGDSHTCAIRRNATLWCWGAGDEGELGNGQRNSSWQPVPVVLPGPVRRVVVGKRTTCARLDDRRWFCWGANLNGEIAPPLPTTPNPPVLAMVPSQAVLTPRLLDLSEL